MATFEFIKQDDQNFFIEGDLTLASLNKKKIKSIKLLDTTNEITIDLAKVISTDSAGLAVLIEWIKQSKQSNTKLAFKNVPHQLLTLAKLSGVELDEYFTDFNEEHA
jgi:phospholipid transport system transporter-binding protein